MVDLTDITTIRRIMYEYKISAQKKFGQHFLINQDTLSDIINASELKTQLDLTNEQTEKVEQIIETFRKEMQELRENSSGDRSEMRGQMMAIRNKQNKQN